MRACRVAAARGVDGPAPKSTVRSARIKRRVQRRRRPKPATASQQLAHKQSELQVAATCLGESPPRNAGKVTHHGGRVLATPSVGAGALRLVVAHASGGAAGLAAGATEARQEAAEGVARAAAVGGGGGADGRPSSLRRRPRLEEAGGAPRGKRRRWCTRSRGRGAGPGEGSGSHRRPWPLLLLLLLWAGGRRRRAGAQAPAG